MQAAAKGIDKTHLKTYHVTAKCVRACVRATTQGKGKVSLEGCGGPNGIGVGSFCCSALASVIICQIAAVRNQLPNMPNSMSLLNNAVRVREIIICQNTYMPRYVPISLQMTPPIPDVYVSMHVCCG